ncbi:MAG: TonB-dependent receptor [Gemmatimonadaceae bacterium]|nr:TonB-dependent receptor [Gemmatimonadaceae bacterium]
MPHSLRSALVLLAMGTLTTTALADQAPKPTRADSARPATTLPPLRITATTTASPVASDPRTIAQPMLTLGGAALRTSNAASLGETLEQLPGVRSLSMTTGIGKPVIRGLTNNRVITLANGQRTETQQWGHDHSPNVESADAERIEVVKGPASVLYGSDALGGVVNVLRRPLPVSDPGSTLTRGRLSLGYHSAMLAPSLTAVGEGARGSWGWRASGTGRWADDLRTPTGVVANTGNHTRYGEVGLGWRTDSNAVTVTGSTRREEIAIADDPVTDPGYTGRQRIGTERITVEQRWQRGGNGLRMVTGWEQNHRLEYESATTRDVTLGLRSTNLNALAHWQHAPLGALRGVIGVDLQRTTFRTFGNETLIPDNTASTIGLYAFEQVERGPLAWSAGLRHDWRALETPGNSVLALAPTTRRFRALTGTVGVVIGPRAPVGLALNVARGFRAPSASDLFANGFHEGTRAFEIGDPRLRVESSLNTDVGVRVRHARVTGEVTGYVNRIRDYIYLAPVGNDGRALDSLQVLQGHAQLVGVEAAATVPLAARWSFSTTADYVRARNRVDGTALPFVPPPRVAATLRWDRRAPGPYASITTEYNAKQTRTFRADFAPAAWTVLSASVGRGVVTPRGLVFVDLSVRNALNVRYRDFMSRYKSFADAAGRAFVLRVSADL